MMKKVLVSFSLITLAALASCQATRPLPRLAETESVEGQWVDSSGIVSTFQGGTFTTKTTDTNQLLASGTYTNLTPKLVQISMTSLLRNTQSKVNCSMVSADRLNCTTQTGSQFSLRRASTGFTPVRAPIGGTVTPVGATVTTVQ